MSGIPRSSKLASLLCLNDFEAAARRFLPRPIFGYVAGAVEDNVSYDANLASFKAFHFLPRVLVNVSTRTAATTLFGTTYDAPFGIAPMGISALSAYRGDVVLSKAAAEANVPMIISGSSLIRLEDIAEANPAAWFQAYLPGDTSRIAGLIARIRDAGYRTLVITVDTPVAANRENNVRTGFSTPLRPSLRLAVDGVTHPAWLFGTFFRTLLRHGMPHFENNYAERGAPILSPNVLRDFSDRGHLTWEHFSQIRAMWPGTLVIKGVLRPEDAITAYQRGAEGIIVSNHGGRQLDGTVAPLRVLPRIVEATPQIPVMLDGGVRRGTDVLKAIALGAKCVFVGRPFQYAAAIGGEAGITHALTLLRDEVMRDMGMLGVDAIDAIDMRYLMDAHTPPGRQSAYA